MLPLNTILREGSNEMPSTSKHPDRRMAHLDGLLDEALMQTFPASDPIAINVELGPAKNPAHDSDGIASLSTPSK